MKFVPKSPIDNKSVLIQVMAWQWISNITWTNVDKYLWFHMASLDHNDYKGHNSQWHNLSAVYFTKEVNPSLAKPPLLFNGGLAKLGLTSFVN